MIIDTGATLSILPQCYSSGLLIKPTATKLSATNGDSINRICEVEVEIALPVLKKNFVWTFVVADTTHPLLGVDFLSHHNLLVDCGQRKLIDGQTNFYAPTKTTEHSCCQVIMPDVLKQPPCVQSLFKKYPTLLTPTTSSLPIEPKIFHHIETNDMKPTFAKVRQLSDEKREVVHKERSSPQGNF